MPGAPNRPPDPNAPPPPAPGPKETPQERTLRRLAPSRVALRLPLWKGAPSVELLQPLSEAESKFSAGDFAGAESSLDRLAVRFAEPRWPSLPVPFRSLRVPIPTPQPPQWDPDHALPPEEKEARKWRRYGETQLALARGSIEAESARGTSVGDLADRLAAAEAAAKGGEFGPAFWQPVDEIWNALRERAPLPASAPPRPPPPPAPEAAGAED